ncbi:MAG: glutathione S-transferase family protein [Pseudomonadales bacterium]|nr:glutathione S-transferase family protein [Pseudomonadales bacterium]
MIKLYGAPNTRAARPLWLLEELGMEYEYIFVDLMAGQTHSSDFLKLNPNAKLPVLVDGDFVLLETNAICRYIVDKMPDSGLFPLAGEPAYRHEQWCNFQLTELELPAFMLRKNEFVYPDALRIPELEATMLWEVQRASNILSQGLAEQDYILGKDFTLVDIHLGFTLLWLKSINMPIEQDNIKAYMHRLFSREAFQKLVKKGYLFAR